MHRAVQTLDPANPVVVQKQLPLTYRDMKPAGFGVRPSGGNWQKPRYHCRTTEVDDACHAAKYAVPVH
jgi:hypothetical protein